jgi:phage gp29-like protein
MSRIVSMEDAAARGDAADLQWFWHHMMQTDVTVASAVAKRLSHIDSLDWEIRLIENADPCNPKGETDERPDYPRF